MDYESNKPRISKLIDINYRAWQIQVSRLLKAQGLYGAINGKFLKILREAAKEESIQDNDDSN